MRILGIDPGSRKIVLAVLEGDFRRYRALAYATVHFREKELVERLRHLAEVVDEWLETWEPDGVAVEEVFVRKNASSALILGQARGATLVTVIKRGLVPLGYAPAMVKKTVAGHGRAGKDEVKRMVQLQLQLDKLPGEDAADALAVAITHMVQAGFPGAGGSRR